MKRILLLCLIVFFLSCKSSQRSRVITTKKEAQKAGYTPKAIPATSKTTPSLEKTAASTATSVKTTPSKVQDIINTALSYKGTPYKYNGTTRSGMDCSGLVYTSFTKNDVSLQRSSYLIATQGKKIKLSQVRPGDLVFFITDKNKNRINHVGLVTEINGNDIKFIHATTSRGVLISSIHETYWDNAFVEARNIL